MSSDEARRVAVAALSPSAAEQFEALPQEGPSFDPSWTDRWGHVTKASQTSMPWMNLE
jgi:hypothetical protein